MRQFKDTTYYVEEDGRVFSKKSNRYLKPFKMKNGYYVINLGKYNRELVHRLVAKVYLENPNQFKEVNHKDGNKENNHMSNLEWCTRQQNCQHAHDLGLNYAKKGSNNVNSLLTEDQVLEIRRLHKTKIYSCRQIGEMFGVKGSTIDYIVNYKAWKHVK